MSDEPQAGRELDALIAEKVMGHVVRSAAQVGCRVDEVGVDDFYTNKPDAAEPRWGHMLMLPPYSTNIAAAWEVVEKLRHSDIPYITVERLPTSAKPEFSGWRVFIGYDVTDACTAPLAICRAALKAVRVAAGSGPTGPSTGESQ